MGKLTKAQFIMKARKMFDGQFPNEIKMNVPRFDWMDVEEKSIKEELWDFFRVSIEKYDELVIKDSEELNQSKEDK